MDSEENKKSKFDIAAESISDPTHGLLNKSLDFHEYLSSHGITDSIDEILRIAKVYTKGSSEATLDNINNDSIILASHLIFISIKLGELKGKLSFIENNKNFVRSKNTIHIKKSAENINVKTTDAEADNLSRVISQPIYNEIGIINTSVEYLTNLMYSGRSLQDTLNNVGHRLIKEMNTLSN